MRRAEPGRLLVAAVGNPDRGDDGVGRAVLEALGGRLPAGSQVASGLHEPSRLLAALEQAEAAWLIDAADFGAAAGSISRFDLHSAPLPARREPQASSHGFGLAATLALARALGRLPARCIVYAVQGADFAPGAALSPAVRSAVPELVRRLGAEIGAFTGQPAARDA